MAALLRSVSSVCRVVDLSAGETILEEGAINRGLYMLLKGEIEILMGPDHTKVGRVLAGDVLGEIALVANAPYSATARAAGDSQFIVLTHEDFSALIGRYPRVGMTIMKNIARSLGDNLIALDITVAQQYGAGNQDEAGA